MLLSVGTKPLARCQARRAGRTTVARAIRNPTREPTGRDDLRRAATSARFDRDLGDLPEGLRLSRCA